MLWRHGQTDWNVAGRFQGSTDIPLNTEGVAQARRAARQLAAQRPDAVISSDLARAARTAAELTALTGGGPPRLYEALRETSAGVWEGLTTPEIVASHPEDHAAWKRGEPVRRGGGELETEVADRAVPAVLTEADKLPAGGTLVVVSHGGAIRVTIGRLLGLAPSTWEALGGLANCHWSVLREEEHGWRLLQHNTGTLPDPTTS